jgi:hypothetical protein
MTTTATPGTRTLRRWMRTRRQAWWRLLGSVLVSATSDDPRLMLTRYKE